MAEPVTHVNCGGNWEMLFYGDEVLLGGHGYQLDPMSVAEALQGREYDEVRGWDATAASTDVSFVDREGMIDTYLKENGVSVLFDANEGDGQ